MAVRVGKDTLLLQCPVAIRGAAAVGGKRESRGPLAGCFDHLWQDNTLGQKSWEAAESLLQKEALDYALEKSGLKVRDMHYLFAGDLQSQCTASVFGLRESNVPFVGLYGACSTMAESLGLAALFLEGGFARHTAAVTSSHFCAAERQFRFPLEYGGQRPPSAQWTATAAGAAILGLKEEKPEGVFVRGVTFGRMVDLGIKDANCMGAAMAPAAADTLCRFLADTGKKPEDFDLILTGDLGEIGSALLEELTRREGVELADLHKDCGLLLYDRATQPQVGAGGSGCGCSASVLCGAMVERLRRGELNDLLFLATGALLSTTSGQQGNTIPGVAHLVWLSHHPAKEGIQWNI